MSANKISDQLRVSADTSKHSTDLSYTIVEKNSENVVIKPNKPSLYASTRAILSTSLTSLSNAPRGIISALMHYINHFVLLFIFINIAVINQAIHWYHYCLIKFYTLIYYPNRSPQVIRDDINKLPRIPKRVSCILDLKHSHDENGGIEGLINNISELTAWSISAGIPNLVIYEYNGVLINNYQTYLPKLVKYLNKNLANYFGSESLPVFSIRIPHKNLIIYSNGVTGGNTEVNLQISLLSRTDGKPTIVELTKTMSELAINKELSIKDITIDLIDEELIELVGPEPDLLISFGPNLDLQDYPPWHIRLTEIYWEPDNRDVNYAIFLRALQNYAHCKINVGK